MAELKVRVDGLPVVLVFPFEDDVAPKGAACLETRDQDIPSLLSNTLEKIVNRLRGSGPQGTTTLAGSAPTVVKRNPEAGTIAVRSGVETVLRVGLLELNLLDRTAKRGGRAIDLRPREFQLLRYMMERLTNC